jgi:1-pyrroline-5-carboxylate dehydrogenase
MDAVSRIPEPKNLRVLDYQLGSVERDELETALKELSRGIGDIPSVIGGESIIGGGERRRVVQPHRHREVLAEYQNATPNEALTAVEHALLAAKSWRTMSYDDRSSIFLRAAELLAGPWRMRLNASTMLGQSKTVIQAEIDAACELADFWRFNVKFGRQIIEEQPLSTEGVWNQLDHRPLEGFVCAITPFNFTAIAGNLPTAPALMGNVVVWKPSETQLLSAYLTLRLLEEAGLPPGVINLITGDADAITTAVIPHPSLAGIHFTGSTTTFRHLWQEVGANIGSYRTYPRLVGETGGKDFILAHNSADLDVLRVAMVRGAFEYQGQKCSAASRAYIPRSLWKKLKDELVDDTNSLKMGDVSDFSNFLGAVIDRRAYDRLKSVLDRSRRDDDLDVIAGGAADDSEGFFVRPAIALSANPFNRVFSEEYFGPFLAVHVYDDSRRESFSEIATAIDQSTPYGLTGSVIANDREAVVQATKQLRFTAGNFYINDKPTGAVVGQQPFGGSRASGTNDKAGSILNLQRWVSPRSIKETFVGPRTIEYPYQGKR